MNSKETNDEKTEIEWLKELGSEQEGTKHSGPVGSGSKIGFLLEEAYPPPLHLNKAALAEMLDYIKRSPSSRIPSDREIELEKEISTKQNTIWELTKTLDKTTAAEREKEAKIRKLREENDHLRKMQELKFVVDRIEGDARRLLLESEELQRGFLDQKQCESFVMSIDIRRSTELMLKARRPELYATFLDNLSQALRDVILACHGVYDKFTGDGILAFFPDFFTGEDAGYYALKAATQAHEIFQRVYDSSRHCFSTILMDIGLGIGIDFGETHLVRLGDGLTVVGRPVVYACRMGGAKAGTTLLNQEAFERIWANYGGYCIIEPIPIDVKREGTTLAYSVRLNQVVYTPKPPKWRSLLTKDEAAAEKVEIPAGETK